MRDVKLGRTRRVLLEVILEEQKERAAANLKTAEQNQHMLEFRYWCNVEHQITKIQEALRAAS